MAIPNISDIADINRQILLPLPYVSERRAHHDADTPPRSSPAQGPDVVHISV